MPNPGTALNSWVIDNTGYWGSFSWDAANGGEIDLILTEVPETSTLGDRRAGALGDRGDGAQTLSRLDRASVIEALKQNLPWILPIALPVVFFVAGLLVKVTLGQRDFHFFGGDLAFCGCAILCSSALRQILFRKVTEPSEIVLILLAVLLFLGAWYFSLVLGRAKVLWRSLVAICLGTATFYLCAYFAWRILDLAGS